MPKPREFPAVVSDSQMSNSFLGDTIQVCIVSRDHKATMTGLLNLGIGPWRIYEFNSSNTENMTFRGKSADYSMKVCLALSGTTSWEVIQPIKGPSIYTEFLDRNGEGIQHIGFGCGNMDYVDRIKHFREKGYEIIQSGVFRGRIPYHYFGTEKDAHTIIEIYDVPPDFNSEPDEWFPAPPP